MFSLFPCSLLCRLTLPRPNSPAQLQPETVYGVYGVLGDREPPQPFSAPRMGRQIHVKGEVGGRDASPYEEDCAVMLLFTAVADASTPLHRSPQMVIRVWETLLLGRPKSSENGCGGGRRGGGDTDGGVGCMEMGWARQEIDTLCLQSLLPAYS